MFLQDRPRQEVSSHFQSDAVRHLHLAVVTLNETQQATRKLEEKLNSSQEEFKANTRKLEEKLNSSQEEFKANTRKLEEKLNSCQETTRNLEEKVKALENRTMQCREEYTWKISGFSEVLRQAISGEKTITRSAPFYYYGYKFRLQLYPNGCSEENTHLTIGLFLMKGEYDAISPWPFHKKVTFTLIDQNEEPNKRKNIVVSFTSHPENKVETRDRAVTNEDGRWSFNLISHNRLRKRCYMADENIFIQVKISAPATVATPKQK